SAVRRCWRDEHSLLAGYVYVDVAGRDIGSQLIQHPIRGAEQTMRGPDSSDCCGQGIKRRLPNREGQARYEVLVVDARGTPRRELTALTDYSFSTAAGFTRAARRAGNHGATSATVARRTAT